MFSGPCKVWGCLKPKFFASKGPAVLGRAFGLCPTAGFDANTHSEAGRTLPKPTCGFPALLRDTNPLAGLSKRCSELNHKKWVTGVLETNTQGLLGCPELSPALLFHNPSPSLWVLADYDEDPSAVPGHHPLRDPEGLQDQPTSCRQQVPPLGSFSSSCTFLSHYFRRSPVSLSGSLTSTIWTWKHLQLNADRKQGASFSRPLATHISYPMVQAGKSCGEPCPEFG